MTIRERVSEAPRQAKRGTVRSVRRAAWRVLGTPPAWSAAAAASGRMKKHPWKALRREGLRVERGLTLLGSSSSKGIRVHFEAPVQLNNSDMHVYRDIRIGRYTFLRTGTIRYVDAIGRYTSIGPGVILGEAEHPTHWLTMSPTVYDKRRWFFYPPDADRAAQRLITRDDSNTAPNTRQNVTIGNDVWIGANAIVRRGVTIGDGAVVAAGAFVNHDVAPYTIVGGLPAKVIGQRFDDDVIAKLLALRWWEFDINDLDGVDVTRVEEAIDGIRSREDAGQIERDPVAYSSVKITRGGYSGLVHPR